MENLIKFLTTMTTTRSTVMVLSIVLYANRVSLLLFLFIYLCAYPNVCIFHIPTLKANFPHPLCTWRRVNIYIWVCVFVCSWMSECMNLFSIFSFTSVLLLLFLFSFIRFLSFLLIIISLILNLVIFFVHTVPLDCFFSFFFPPNLWLWFLIF